MDRYILNLSTPKRSEKEIKELQDKKNNQDFVYQTNQSLQNLGVQIKNVSKELEKHVAKTGEDNKSIEIKFENFQEEIKKNIQENVEILMNFRNIMASYKDEFDKRINKYKDDHTRIENCEKDCDSSFLNFEKNECRLKRLEDIVESSVRDFMGKLHTSVDCLRKELTPVKPKIDPIEEKVSKMICEFKIDHIGIQREMNIIKKEATYREKKIEKLLTDVKNLQGNK